MPQIILNGKPHDAGSATTVRDLLAGLKLTETQVAVERNKAIVPRATYGEAPVEEGDHFEVVTFVGGG